MTILKTILAVLTENTFNEDYMDTIIPLTKPQKEIMKDFFNVEPTKVIFTKTERTTLWDMARTRKEIPHSYNLETTCPALANEINQSYISGNNIQSAVFSECVYAQTLAKMFNLEVFHNCRDSFSHIPQSVLNLLTSYSLLSMYRTRY